MCLHPFVCIPRWWTKQKPFENDSPFFFTDLQAREKPCNGIIINVVPHDLDLFESQRFESRPFEKFICNYFANGDKANVTIAITYEVTWDFSRHIYN